MIPMTGARLPQTESNWERARLIVDAEQFFERLLHTIADAQHSIDFEYYSFQLDRLGNRFVAALGAAASRGVRVRVMVDGIGSAAASSALAKQLFDCGVAVQIYHPLPWLTDGYRWSRPRGGWIFKMLTLLLNVNRRNHRKLCIVDGHTAWVGSFNITADHLPVAAGGLGWRDYALELQGRTVQSLVNGFERLWNDRNPRLHRGFIGRYLSNRSLPARRMKNRFVVHSVATAATRVWLVSAYFAPTARLRRALLKACRNGIDVRLLLPSRSDVIVFPGLSSHYYRELLRAGARIFLYQESVLHARALLVDDLVILGSSNWNHRSTLHDLELDAIVNGVDTVNELAEVIREDCNDGRELSLEQTPVPAWHSWFWYLLRYWM